MPIENKGGKLLHFPEAQPRSEIDKNFEELLLTLDSATYNELTSSLRQVIEETGIIPSQEDILVAKSLKDHALIGALNNSNKFLWQSKPKYYMALVGELADRIARLHSNKKP